MNNNKSIFVVLGLILVGAVAGAVVWQGGQGEKETVLILAILLPIGVVN